MIVHKLKQRVKQLGEPISSKHTPTPKTPTKSKRSTVVELDDDDDNFRAIYAARFDQLESQMKKVTEQWSIATADNAKFKRYNKSLQDDNHKLSASLKKGVLYKQYY